MNLFADILKLVAQIPIGKVTTYGTIAKVLNLKDVRKVGYALHQNKKPEEFPCHRVVKKDGSLASGYAFGGKVKQRDLLIAEGVSFLKDKVNLAKHFFDF